MADDQGTKTTSIDNLINELTKQKSSEPSSFAAKQTSGSASPVAGSAPFSPKPVVPSEIKPPPAVSKPVIPPAGQAEQSVPAPAFIPKPVTPQPFVSKPVPQPASPIPPTSTAPITSPPPLSSSVKEYQSSIRTMSDDLSSLKTGQKPSGINIPRTVEPLKPIAPTPVLPKPPVLPPPSVPQVKLGEIQKTGPMAQQKGQVGPIMPPAPKKEEPSQIIIPESGKKMIGGNFLYIGIAAIIVLGGAVYWYFVIKTPSMPETIITPIPSATTPTPVATLEQLLSDASPVNVDLSASENPLSDFNKTIKNQIVSGGVLNSLNVKISTEETKPALTDIMDKFLIFYPAQLKTSLGNESAVLLYGQKEVFTAKGLPDTSAINAKRIIFVTKINDFALAASISKEWELTMTDGFKEIFELDSKKAASKIFLDSMYREINIRYINFAYPDNTIDYAIVPASNGKFYLVISGSREAMYEVIDKLK